MSQYRIENLTKFTENQCETLDDCIAIAAQNPDDNYTIYELCRENEYVVDIDIKERIAERLNSIGPSPVGEWMECTDERYWSEEPGIETMIQVTDCWGRTEVYTRYACPFAWGTLCRLGAKMINIKL